MDNKKRGWLVDWMLGLVTPTPYVEHRTIDGGRLAPHPNMTDEDLYDFERDMKVPNPTWKSFQEFAQSQLELGSRSEFVQGPKVVDDLQAVAVDRTARNLAGTPLPSTTFKQLPLPPVGKRMIVELTPEEEQTGVHRIALAEVLIRQLPADHEGRNAWLTRYGTTFEAVELRRRHMPKGPASRPVKDVLHWARHGLVSQIAVTDRDPG